MEIIIKTSTGELIIKDPVASDFKDWLDYECYGAEPTEELWEEFCWLENMFRKPLIDILSDSNLLS